MWSAERMVGNIFLFTPVDTKIMWSIRIVLLRADIHHILTLLFIFKKPEHRVWHCARCLSIEPRTIWHLNQQCITTQHNTTQYCKIYFWLRALASVWAIKGKKVWDAGRQNMQGHEFCAIPLILSAPPPPPKSFLILLLGSPSLLVHSHCIRSPVLSTSQSHFPSPFENSFQIICLTRGRDCC